MTSLYWVSPQVGTVWLPICSRMDSAQVANRRKASFIPRHSPHMQNLFNWWLFGRYFITYVKICLSKKKLNLQKLDELYPFWSENIKLNFWCVYIYSHETIHRYNWGTIFRLFLREIPGIFHVFTHEKVDFTAAENAREMNILNQQKSGTNNIQLSLNDPKNCLSIAKGVGDYICQYTPYYKFDGNLSVT